MARGKLPATKVIISKPRRGSYPLARCAFCNQRYRGKIIDVASMGVTVISCMKGCFFLGGLGMRKPKSWIISKLVFAIIFGMVSMIIFFISFGMVAIATRGLQHIKERGFFRMNSVHIIIGGGLRSWFFQPKNPPSLARLRICFRVFTQKGEI